MTLFSIESRRLKIGRDGKGVARIAADRFWRHRFALATLAVSREHSIDNHTTAREKVASFCGLDVTAAPSAGGRLVGAEILHLWGLPAGTLGEKLHWIECAMWFQDELVKMSNRHTMRFRRVEQPAQL